MSTMMTKAKQLLLEAANTMGENNIGDGGDGTEADDPHRERQMLPVSMPYESTPTSGSTTKTVPTTSKAGSSTTAAVPFGRAISTTTPIIQDIALAAGYKYDHGNAEEQQDEDEEELYFPYDDPADETTQVGTSSTNDWKNKVYTTVVRKRNPQHRREQIPYVYLLGSILHPIHDYEKRKALEEKSLFWFTYRYDFPEIKPYGITTDAGWGCMLRSAQMLLAHALRVHFSQGPSHWRRNNYYLTGTTISSALLTWFVDMPSTDKHFYSLHNMCAAGLAKHQVLPGEWYGPGTASLVVRDLVAMHQQASPSLKLFRVHVATEGTIYRQVVEELMTRDGRKRRQDMEDEEKKQQPPPQDTKLPAHPLDALAVINDPTPATSATKSSTSTTTTNSIPLEWDTSLLLLIPLRLGLDKFQEEYAQSLARVFALPQSVGVLGGRPRGARWFYGAYGDGSKVLGLDPHTVQPAVTSFLRQNGNGNMTLPEEFVASTQVQYPETFDLIRMDPSIALGFYCRNRKDLEALEVSLKEIDEAASVKMANKSTNKSSQQQMVAFMDKAPNYEDDFEVNDEEDDLLTGQELTPYQDDDDEDDFVFL